MQCTKATKFFQTKMQTRGILQVKWDGNVVPIWMVTTPLLQPMSKQSLPSNHSFLKTFRRGSSTKFWPICNTKNKENATNGNTHTFSEKIYKNTNKKQESRITEAAEVEKQS